ncbi:pirin family protein [Thalassotalea ganghwensis]
MASKLVAQTHDLGAFKVKRILPNAEQRMVGPFIFFDQFGPAEFSPGQGVDVRPHPHIGLSTLSYLLEGSMLHRDSLGNIVEIHPGDVNWMTSGSGIVHSERETIEVRATKHKLSGVQCWVALPEALAEMSPNFEHVNKISLPQRHLEGIMMRVIVGEAYGLKSPVTSYSPMFFIDMVANENNTIAPPNPAHETAIYVIYGEVTLTGEQYSSGDFVVLNNQDQHINFSKASRVLVLGGEKFDKQPFLHWNFVAYTKARIEQAKLDWQEQRFAKVIDDTDEFIPL